MNGTTTSLVPEMLNSTDANMTVLERQRAHFKWQHQVQEQEIIGYSNYLGELCGDGAGEGGLLAEVVSRSVKPDPGLIGNGWPDLVGCCGSGGGGTSGACGDGSSNYMDESSFGYNSHQNNNGLGIEFNYAISKTSRCPPGAALTAGVAEKMASVIGVGAGRESSKKRKANKVVVEEDSRDKRSKGCGEEGESKITEKCSNHKNGTASNNNKSDTTNKKGSNNNNENSAETSKDNNSKVTEVQKPDFIHVRARRGQATDSHSLAERVRREKISERMKYLQDLVPGCNKITGKAGMLDEIINYVQSLQRQVEFLSMKLAAVNPRLDFNIDNLFAKEAFPACLTNFPTIGMSLDMTNSAYLQFNQSQQQIVATCGLEMGINPPDLGLRRTISAPVSIPETFIDSSCFNQIQPTATWDADLQNLYNVAFDQGRTTSFPCQPFTGPIDAGNLMTKMEM